MVSWAFRCRRSARTTKAGIAKVRRLEGVFGAINRTMRARSPRSAWEIFTGGIEPLPWLAAVDPAWDLLETDDLTWSASGCAAVVDAAMTKAIAPYRNLSVATKVLHLKRPRLIPVLDSLVVDQIGAHGKPPRLMLGWIRDQGRENLAVLREVQGALGSRDHSIDRTLLRILDAMLWATHPAAGLAGKLGNWEHRLTLRRR